MASSSRRKSKKVGPGLSRMDAALEHLQVMGFSKKVITTTVKSLLKVYGDNGWLFLEENNYQVVVDEILAIKEDPTVPQLPPLPQDQMPVENGEKQHQGGETTPETGMTEQRNENGSSGGIETPPAVAIEFMDESLLGRIPPGRRRAPLYGYLSETDSNTDFDDADSDSDSDVSFP